MRIQEDGIIPTPLRKAQKTQTQGTVTDIFTTINQECKECKPVTPLACITSCSVWKLRNELRLLSDTMDNPHYMKDLFNVLKNETRLRILQTIDKRSYPVSRLQQELKRIGFQHSQDTLVEEYLKPLLKVGLAIEAQDHFQATVFASRIAELIGYIPEFAEFLPAHSECYEENILESLLARPKTFEEIKGLIPPEMVPRSLKRLKTQGLIETPEDRDYIFFFRSKRDPAKEKLDTTENKVYLNIPDQGISAKKLSKKTGLSPRRTYKYVRGLKGKKLVFARKTPKTYCLTEKGERLAWLLNELRKLVKETMDYSEQFSKYKRNS